MKIFFFIVTLVVKADHDFNIIIIKVLARKIVLSPMFDWQSSKSSIWRAATCVLKLSIFWQRRNRILVKQGSAETINVKMMDQKLKRKHNCITNCRATLTTKFVASAVTHHSIHTIN